MSDLATAHSRMRFGVFELDLQTGELRKSGFLLHLPPQPFKVLALLVSRPAQLVTREEMRNQIWGTDTFVDFEHGLNAAIKTIRDTLGDDPETPRYIETLPRRGYRFIAPVDGIPAGTKPRLSIQTAESSQQTALGAEAARKSTRFRWAVISGAAILVIGLAVGSWLLYSRKAPVVSEKDTIVLADFINSTGDPVFDGTLRQGLSAQLQQSPFFNILSDDQIAATLRLMEKPADTRLTHDVAREVCRRTNATAVIEGSIAALGNQYAIGLSTSNCRTGAILAEEQTTAEGKEKVLAALGAVTSGLRARLGESRDSLERFDAPLDQVTTPSLEALQAYTMGVEAGFKGDYPVAISFLQRAVGLDPNFAVAYGVLGVQYYDLGDSRLSMENEKRAYDLRARVSDSEELAISGTYFLFLGDLEKAVQAFDLWARVYPRNAIAHHMLGATDLRLGRYDQAIAEFREDIRLDPTLAFGYRLLADSYMLEGRFDEARATIHQAEANHVDPSVLREVLYLLAFLRNDSAGMAQQLAGPWVGPPDAVDQMQSHTAAYSGHLSQARNLAQRAIASAKQQGANDVVAHYRVKAAFLEALFGHFPEARKTMENAGNSMTNRDVGGAAVVWALSGDAAQAQKLADDFNRRFPNDTIFHFNYLPVIRATLAFKRGNVQEALENLRNVSPYELSAESQMLPVYVRGQIYLEAHHGAEAAAEFQKILDHPGIVFNDPGIVFSASIGALAHLGLGRAFASQGDTSKARAAYQDFLTLWKDADPDIPVLKQAKAEYAKLQ